MVDGRVPQLERKNFLEFNDFELLKVASDLKMLSKEICSATELSFRRDPNMFNKSLDEINAKKLIKPKTAIGKPKYKPQPLLPPAPLTLKLSRHKERAKSCYNDRLKGFYNKTKLINLHELKSQTKLKLVHFDDGKNSVIKKPFKNDEEKDADQPKFFWKDVKPEFLPEKHTGLKFERIKVSFGFFCDGEIFGLNSIKKKNLKLNLNLFLRSFANLDIYET